MDCDFSILFQNFNLSSFDSFTVLQLITLHHGLWMGHCHWLISTFQKILSISNLSFFSDDFIITVLSIVHAFQPRLTSFFLRLCSPPLSLRIVNLLIVFSNPIDFFPKLLFYLFVQGCDVFPFPVDRLLISVLNCDDVYKQLGGSKRSFSVCKRMVWLIDWRWWASRRGITVGGKAEPLPSSNPSLTQTNVQLFYDDWTIANQRWWSQILELQLFACWFGDFQERIVRGSNINC